VILHRSLAPFRNRALEERPAFLFVRSYATIQHMRILIATGVYPPDHGGPGFYAKSLKDEFESLGHSVVVKTYRFEHSLPTGIRHLFYLMKTLPAFLKADMVIALDTFSVGLPIALLQKAFRRCVLLRTGGDFLWEAYVERTKEKVLLSEFYKRLRALTFKERLIFRATRFTLNAVSHVIFSTTYQRDIWIPAYGIRPEKVSIIENRFEPSKELREPQGKTFVYAAARELVWKNVGAAKEAVHIAQKSVPDARLELLFYIPRERALEKIEQAYAVILTSLGDISPNYILRALSLGKPVILTNENGLRSRIGDAAMYVDPLDPAAIARAVVAMSDPSAYTEYRRRVAALSYTHTYADIAQEFLALCSKR
jgi:glycosyltransferase involved in cell wall biosynthesis